VLAVSFLSLGLHTKPLRRRSRSRPRRAGDDTAGVGDHNARHVAAGHQPAQDLARALIIALGLLVDDAIIAVEMMVRMLEEGASKAVAVTAMYETTAMPMLTGTLITAVGFLPIALAKSVAGEYTMSISRSRRWRWSSRGSLPCSSCVARRLAAEGEAQGRRAQ